MLLQFQPVRRSLMGVIIETYYLCACDQLQYTCFSMVEVIDQWFILLSRSIINLVFAAPLQGVFSYFRLMVDADNVTQGLQLVEQQTDALLLLMKSEGLPAINGLVSRQNSIAHTMIAMQVLPGVILVSFQPCTLIIGHDNIGIIFYCIGNSQWCFYKAHWPYLR